MAAAGSSSETVSRARDPRIDHRAFLRAMHPAERRRLTAREDGPGLLRLAVHLGAIALLSTLVFADVEPTALFMLLSGIFQVFLFTTLHEVSHSTAFKTRALNDWTGRLCGFVLFLGPEWFRFFHFAHHKHTQDPENDPELASPKPETIGAYLLHVSGLPVWRSQLETLIGNAIGARRDVYVPDDARPRVIAEARTMIALYGALLACSLFFASAALFWVWILPVLIGQPFLRLYLLAEHGRCPFVADMFQNTRTTFTNRFLRFLAWNMPYHAEHHAFPGAPFHKLPELHARANEHLRVTEKGYGRFTRKYVEALR